MANTPDLQHGDGNSTQASVISRMGGLKDNTGANKYGKQNKGPKASISKPVQSGWNK